MTKRIAFLAHSLAIAGNGSEIQLLPASEFEAVDGRPGNGLKWKIDSRIAQRLIDQLAAQKNSLVIDYEHQTFRAEKNGQPAPAAGWLKQLEWREGQGLFAVNVEWTDEAKDFIAQKKYRYISPTFAWAEKTGEITRLLPVALTNFPALDGMDAVSLSQLIEKAQLSFETKKENTMDHTALCKLLGIKEDSTDAEITAAINTLKTQAAKAGELETAAATLRNNSTQTTAVDASKYVGVEVVEALKTQIATLTASHVAREVEDLIAPALADGRILPAQENWARELGQSSIAQLKTYIETAQPIAALKGSQTGGKPPVDKDGKTTLTPTQVALCKQIGVSEEDFKKSLAAEAA